MSTYRRAGRLLCALLLLPTPAAAQTFTGAIAGSVQDSSEAAIAAAAVTLTQVDTQFERHTLTNERGAFFFASLQPGAYSLKVRKAGFKTSEDRSLQVVASETLAAGVIVLEVGSVSETVTVAGQVANVQLVSGERSAVLTGDQVENILVRGRNVTDMLALLPGIVLQADNENINTQVLMNANGGRTNANSLSVDGMGINQIGSFANNLLVVSQDSVAEVKVLLTNYQAEYGRNSGANVQIVSKSGTRVFHGLASYFKRHEEFNADSFFNNRLGLPKGRYRYNTWNYNIGGPIYIPGKFNSDRNRLFFFWSQEFWPSRQATAGLTVTTPTALERTGDFSQSVDLNNRLIPVLDPSNRQPFPGNKVPLNRIDPSGQALLNVFPLPNFTNRVISAGGYNYVFNSETSAPQRLATLRLDYNISARHLLFGSFSSMYNAQEGYRGLATTSANWNEFYRKYWTDPKQVTLRYQFIASPSVVNELTIGGNGRLEKEDYSPDALAANSRQKVGFQVGQFNPQINPFGILPNATFGGISNVANLTYYANTPLASDRLGFVITDNVTKIWGAHIFKTGITAERISAAGANGGAFDGTFDFSNNALNPLATGYPYANSLLGVFNSYSELSNRFVSSQSIKSAEWFVQDTWRLTPRLTLDYGVRLYLLGNDLRRGDEISGFVPSRFNPAQMVQLIRPALVNGVRSGVDPITGAVYPATAIGAIAPGSGNPANGMVVPALDKSYPRSLMDGAGLLLGPRFGFAYDPFGNGKTAIRGGFGVFYNRKDASYGAAPIQLPIVYTPTVYYGTFSTLLSSAGFNFPQAVTGLDRAAKTPSTMNMSFSIQRNIGYGTVVDAGYVGSLGRHLPWARSLDSIPLGADFNPKNADPTNPKVTLPVPFLRQYVGYNDINMEEWAGSSNYHSLQVTANRRFARGLQFGASWTWSKAMDFVDGDTTAVTALVSPRVWNYGLAGFDRTHIFKLNYLWDVPRTPWRRGLANRVLNGWQMSGITSFISGAPLGVGYALVTAQDTTGTPSLTARIVVNGDPVLPKSQRTFDHNFRTDVFAPPALGTIGNSAKTIIRGPGINNWDASLLKNIAIREPFRVQFRCEFYNAFNHTQFSALNTTARFDAQGNQVNAQLGAFTAARNPRIIQFALRLAF